MSKPPPPDLTLAEFIAGHSQLRGMSQVAAEQTVKRWVLSGRIEWKIDPLSGLTTIERKWMKQEEERQALNVRRAQGRLPDES